MAPTDPGWYPDPDDPAVRRYFDGTAWTDLPAPPPVTTSTTLPSPPPPRRTPSPPVSAVPTFEESPRVVLCWTVVVSGVLVAVGSLLAWMTASTGFISISRNAFQMGGHESMTADGPIVMVLGLILVGIGVARLTNTAMPRLVQRSPIIAGLAIGVVLGIDYQSIHQWAASINSAGALGSVGTGFWVCCVGDVLAVGAGVGLMSSERQAKQSAQTATLLL